MRKNIFLLVLLLHGFSRSSAQQVSEKLIYQVAETILEELGPTAISSAKVGVDGKYHWQKPMPTDILTLRLLLLDHTYSPNDSTDEVGQFVLAKDGTQAQARALTYFTLSDLAYMRQQLPQTRQFRFEQTKIRDSWVKIIPLDTVMAINKRLGWQAEYLAGDSLLQRYGSHQTFAIYDILFSKDHQRALVGFSRNGEQSETSMYKKTGLLWRKEGRLQVIYR